MHKLFMPLMLGLAILSFPLMVKAAEIEGAEIIKFGVYKTEIGKKVAAPGAAGGTREIVQKFTLVEQTTRIPARRGTEFGFEYVIKGRPADATIEVTHKFLHPSVTNPQTKRSFTSQTTSGNQKIGRTAFISYAFEHDWEMVPGEWTIQVFCQGKKIAEKSFQVVK